MDIFESIIKVLDKYDIVIKGETYQNIVNNKVKEILENIFCQNKKIAIKGAGIVIGDWEYAYVSGGLKSYH